jgi:RNA polymerase sigma-70 factor (family 1)
MFDKKQHNFHQEFDLDAFRGGKESAFKAVYDQLNQPLLYFAQKIIQSRPDAEEIVSDAFFKLYKSRKRFNGYAYIKSFLYFVVRNKAIDYLRHIKSGKKAEKDLDNMRDLEEEANVEMYKTMMLKELMEAIEKLSPQRRIVILLYFFGHKTTAEIAEELKISPQTVRNHKTDGLQDLKNTLIQSNWFHDPE